MVFSALGAAHARQVAAVTGSAVRAGGILSRSEIGRFEHVGRRRAQAGANAQQGHERDVLGAAFYRPVVSAMHLNSVCEGVLADFEGAAVLSYRGDQLL